MGWRRASSLALFSIGALGLLSNPVVYAVDAPDQTNKGLYISPLRTYLKLDAGQTVARSIRVANLTEKPMLVRTSVESFSAEDYTYEFAFSPPKNNWITFVEPAVTLKPYESRELAYKINLPSTAPAGGQYYSLYAATDVASDSGSYTVRGTSLLYLTINGPLTRTSQIINSSLFPFVVTSTIPYSLDVRNAGNIHYFAYFSAKVDGVSYASTSTGTSQLLMPGTVRRVTGSVPSPVVPGIYKVTYGYKPDQGPAVTREQFILYLPPWFFIALTLVAIIASRFLRFRVKNKVTKTTTGF